MSAKRNLEVCFSPLSYPLFHNPEAIVVVIDVLRATSAICTAFQYGVKSMIPVASVEEASLYKKKGYLVAAERNSEILEGFDFGNSPFSYMDERVKNETIVITTTNGTQGIHAAREAASVVVGSFLNLSILSKWIIEQDRDVLLLCSGWKNKFNLEDSLFAGALAEKLISSDQFDDHCDSTLAARLLYDKAKGDLYGFLDQSSHRKRLARLDLENDVKYCLTIDKAPVIPVLTGIELVKLNYTL